MEQFSPPHVVLVDEHDDQTGTMEKMEAHRLGLLHRAFSIFLFNAEGRMLLQQRAAGKYHSPCLWTNACCSHPLPGETVAAAARRRVHEELGIAPALEAGFQFTYRAELANELVEHEFDHVFFGRWEGVVHPDPEEVMNTRWIDLDEMERAVADLPEQFTAWLLVCWPKVRAYWVKSFEHE
ncbi:MAG: isopentenyl-diphosphate Delta-isomerase [Flavobacteriales bacterium]